MQSGPGRSLPLPGLFLFLACVQMRVFARADRERKGLAPARSMWANVPGAFSHLCAPITPARRADALACEVKEEVTANGRRRGTFARKGIRPAPQEKRTHAQAASTRAIPCQRGYHTRTCPTCLPGTVPSSAHRCVPTAPARRVDALACEVKEEVTANGRRRRTFARKGIRPAPHGKRTHLRTGSLNPSDPMPARIPHPEVSHLPTQHDAVVRTPLRADSPCTPGGCPCVRSKGGGDGHRPAPGDIRTQGHPPGATGKTNTRTGSLNRAIPCQCGYHTRTCPTCPPARCRHPHTAACR